MIADYNRYTAGKWETALVATTLISLLTLIGYIFYGSFFFGIFFPLLFHKCKIAYCRYRVAVRKNELLLQFRDLLHSLSSSFAAGRHMMEAMEEGRVYLREIYGEKCLLAWELENMLRRIHEAGETDLVVWEDLSIRCCLEDISDFTRVFRACRETGGDLVFAVNKAAAVISEKIAVEMEIKTMVSQRKLEGRIIIVMPVALVFFLQTVSPDYLQIMYTTFAGKVLMSLALAAIGAACFMIERITNIEV